jgi:hypothetical protein
LSGGCNECAKGRAKPAAMPGKARVGELAAEDGGGRLPRKEYAGSCAAPDYYSGSETLLLLT